MAYLDLCRPICEEMGEPCVQFFSDEIVERGLDASGFERLNPLDDTLCTFKVALPVVHPTRPAPRPQSQAAPVNAKKLTRCQSWDFLGLKPPPEFMKERKKNVQQALSQILAGTE
jgi:hypothetical protein